MADILDKNLDAYDNSPNTSSPYFLKESDVTPSSFITGEDLARTIRIQDTLKQPIPVELLSLSRTEQGKGMQAIESFLNVPVDFISDLYPDIKNLLGQIAEQGLDSEHSIIKAARKAGIEIPGLTNEDSEYQKTVEMLNGTTYPMRKAVARVIAKSTADTENRKLVRALYDQSHGIDSDKWHNIVPRLLGEAAMIFTPGKAAGTVARFAGGSRYSAGKLTEKIATGTIFAGESGGYAEETAQQYLERTGDKNFENFTPEDSKGLSALAVGAINTKIEKMGGVFPLMFGSLKRVGLRSGFGKVLTEATVGEYIENIAQDITTMAARKIDGTSEKTWEDGIKESLVNSLWSIPVGGVIGTYGHYSNRANLVKGIKAVVPDITDEQATQVADAMIDTGIDIVLPSESLRKNLRDKVALMYRDSDIDNKDAVIDATTDLEYSLIAMDATDRGIDIADHELFQGVVNELGWFRAGIPEEQRTEIKSINDNILELKSQLETLNKTEEKDWAKIEETENKLAQASQYVLEKVSDLATEFKKLEDRYVEKEKQKALDAFEATQEQKELADSSASQVFNTLSNEGINVQQINNGKPTKHGAVYLQINRKGAKSFKIRLGVTPIGALHKSVVANFNVETMTPEQILARVRNLIENKYPQTNKKAKGGVNIGFGEEPMFRQEQFNIADENARLDDIYPEYTGETIEVDGKERTVYNSNGDRIAKSKEALTNFWRWFGDSKVVDEQGRPLVVHHGSEALDIEEFDTVFGRRAIYFSTNEDVSRTYYSPQGKGRTYDMYLRIEKPYVFDANGVRYDEIRFDFEGIRGTEIENLVLAVRESSSNYDGVIVKNVIDMSDKTKTQGIVADDYIIFDETQAKSPDNIGTFGRETGKFLQQGSISGKGDTNRGAYIPEYRFILRANKMDASTLSHELAHDWMEVNFDRYRSGKQGKDFMKAWGALEKALGIPENATSVPRKASEAFARAYEAWIMQNEDWTKFISVDDKDRDAVEKLMKDYQGELRDIYNDISNPYFKQTWGKLGELKPELKAWFDRVVNITDLDVMVERGEMTESQAQAEKLNRAIDTVIENTADEETKLALEEAKTLNDTARYEVEGGNQNSIQRRLSALAKEIDENNMALKGEKYDTRRDMMQVAEAADNFVKTRLDDALAIINGEMAEVEGLYKEDLYTALERLAVENGDLNLIDELKNSEVANRLAKELGQRVAGFRNFKQSTDIDVVSALKSLDMKFNKALDNKKAKQEYDSALKLLDESIKQQDKISDKDLDNFLKELECK